MARGTGDSYFDTTYDFGVVSLATVQPTRFALVCLCVFSVYQQHGQVWSSCQTERLGVLGAGDARTSVDRDAVLILLPRSASRLGCPGLVPRPAGPSYVRR
jgi:hypothetical protein